MIRITIESTLSTSYPLFRLRWILIALQAVCVVFDILNAVLFSSYITRPTWITLAVLSLCSVVMCVWDLTVHQKGSTPPNSPSHSAYHGLHLAPDSAKDDGAQAKRHDKQDEHLYEEVEADASTSMDAPRVSQDEESAPFLLPPPHSSSSEKSDTSSVKHGRPALRPMIAIVALDMFLAFGLGATYVANMVVSSIDGAYYYWDPANGGYALKVHAVIGTAIAVLLHLHCVWKQCKALRKSDRQGFLKSRSTKAIRI